MKEDKFWGTRSMFLSVGGVGANRRRGRGWGRGIGLEAELLGPGTPVDAWIRVLKTSRRGLVCTASVWGSGDID